jgi:hypothetical protein
MGQNVSSTRKDSIDSESESVAKIDNNIYDRQLLKRCEHIHFDVEAWYNILQSQTFYTEFIPISPSIARAFVNYYQTRYNSKNFLNLNDLKLIQSIQHQLKQHIFNSKITNGAFIRLSSRSPKDGNSLDSQKLMQCYHQKLNKLKAAHPHEYTSVASQANMQLIAYNYAQFHSLKITNELEALNIILSSERIFIDLLAALDCQEVQDNKLTNTNNIKLHDWNNNIIIREWNHLLDPSMEFRCFVYQSNLTAISQYDHYCKFYSLQNDLTIQQIKSTIIQYWQEKVKPLLDPFPEKYSNYIVDIGLIGNELECIIIELNPFAPSTGASLFDWKTDINQLTGQTNEIEIRVRSNYFPNIEEYVEIIFYENQLNTELSKDADHEPYFVFLNKIQTQFSS